MSSCVDRELDNNQLEDLPKDIFNNNAELKYLKSRSESRSEAKREAKREELGMDEADKEFRFFFKFRDPTRKIKTQTVRRLLKPFEWTLDDYDLLSEEEKREVDRRLRKSKTFLIQRRPEAKYLEPKKEYQKWLTDEREKITGHQFTMIEEDYEHAKKIWNELKMKNMGDYHDLYLKSDVLLLADVFEKFRNVILENYNLDPAWYYTAPGLAWDAALKVTKVELELLSDPDMLLMFEILGGISMIPRSYVKANNKYMNLKFDREKLSKYLTYLDANNLYGWAMCKPLPVRGFKWMSQEEIGDRRNTPCILEVDLEYPKELHDLHNDYPLAPERIIMNSKKVEKLVPNLNDTKNYIIHHQNLKQRLELGLRLKKIYRGIKFEEEPWLKSYIEAQLKFAYECKE
ncbi:hypothetical protein AWC38_SpisGene21477 [Stylophora pistillata]|uniref:DNA-directed DNA polymerase n=1 Tax=Stylophora pistillata TaxID=50429 RepID=A0A2B4RB56_STYPI|nr:hypothetical protein AWC38_SpisGene21477 [Stylophora pistillata]